MGNQRQQKKILVHAHESVHAVHDAVVFQVNDTPTTHSLSGRGGGGVRVPPGEQSCGM